MKNRQKGIYFKIGKLKHITDEGRPVMRVLSWSSKKSKILRDSLVSLKKYGKLTLYVSYGRYKNHGGNLAEFHNWGEYKTFNSLKEALSLFTTKDLIGYIQSL